MDSALQEQPVAVILAGGRSRRFGADKACALLDGRPLLRHVADALQTAGYHSLVCTNHPTHARFGLPLLRDTQPFNGPLYALRDILTQCNVPRILLTACDMPHLHPAVLRRLWRDSAPYDITLLNDPDGRAAPFPGIYARRLLPQLHDIIAQGRHDLRALLTAAPAAHRIAAATWRALDPEAATLANCNDGLR